MAPQGRTSPGEARTPAGQRPLDVVLRGHGASAAAHGLEEGRARAGPGCPGGTPALRSLRARAAEPQLLAPCPSRRTAQHRAAGRAGQARPGQGRAGQAPGALGWRSPLTGSCSVFLCSRREQQQEEEEEEGAALALCSAAGPGRCPGARAGGLRLQQGALWPAPGSPLRGGRHAAPAHRGKPAWTGGPQPSGCSRGSVPRGCGDGGLGSSPLAHGSSAGPLAGDSSWLLGRALALATAVRRQLFSQATVSCVSCRSCWISCTSKDRQRRGYSAELPAGHRSGS